MAFVMVLLVMAMLRYIKGYQVALLVLGAVLVLRAVPEYGTRLESMTRLSTVLSEDTAGIQGADAATRGRANEMLAAALVFRDYPLWGVGPGMFRFHYQDYAENDRSAARPRAETHVPRHAARAVARRHPADGSAEQIHPTGGRCHAPLAHRPIGEQAVVLLGDRYDHIAERERQLRQRVVRDAVVTLNGPVADAEEREAAEADAWYVLGVRDVINATVLGR